MVADAIGKSLTRITRHAVERMDQRSITRMDVTRVLNTGHHEKKKDEYHSEHGSWAYAIRGEDIDGRALRLVVSFEETNDGKSVLVVTVIDLDDKE